MVSSLPRTYRRVVAGETLTIGARTFEVMTGGGHAPEQIMLFSAADRLFLSADQVLARITPNVGLSARDPDGDPLGIFLRSLESLATSIPSDALVLTGHNLPFMGLPVRARELVGHHAERCDEIVAACSDQPRSGAELVPAIFHRPLDPHQTGFALSELLAHVNYLKRQGRLIATGDTGDGIERVTVN
jgi:glyoxylase-like metal-dependent hydrolase (beta-lactamase superfamily II)